MARNNYVSSIPSSLIITNKNGKIDLGQIENGDLIYQQLLEVCDQVQEYGLNVNDFRKKSETIMEEDLDPSFVKKINTIYENVGSIIEGIDYEGVHYTIQEVLLMVLENQEVLTEPTVIHI